MKKWGVLLTNAPGHEAFASCMHAVRQALAEGKSVYFYCLDEGVRAVSRPEFLELSQRENFHFMACAYAAERRGLPLEKIATYGGLGLLADVMAHADEFLSF